MSSIIPPRDFDDTNTAQDMRMSSPPINFMDKIVIHIAIYCFEVLGNALMYFATLEGCKQYLAQPKLTYSQKTFLYKHITKKEEQANDLLEQALLGNEIWIGLTTPTTSVKPFDFREFEESVGVFSPVRDSTPFRPYPDALQLARIASDDAFVVDLDPEDSEL